MDVAGTLQEVSAAAPATSASQGRKSSIAQVAASAQLRSAVRNGSSPGVAWDMGHRESDTLRERKMSLPATTAALMGNATGPVEAWKVIGSPSRRFSLASAGEQALGTEANNMDDAQQARRPYHSRNSSVPSALMHSGESPPEYPPGLGPSKSSAEESKWPSRAGPWASAPSIWNGSSAGPVQGTAAPEQSTGFLQPNIAATVPFPSRQFRSFSFSLATMRGLDRLEDGSDSFDPDHITTMPLRGDDDEEYDDQRPKERIRSKSSSAIYGLLTQEANNYTYPAEPSSASPISPTGDYPDMGALWNANPNPAAQALRAAHEPSMIHRRASTQSSIHWDLHSRAHTGAEDLSPVPPGSRMDQYHRHRRFSHVPGVYDDFSQQLLGTAGEEYGDMGRRRHSVAGPLYSSSAEKFLAEGLENMNLSNPNAAPFLEEIDDYFENTNRRARAWAEAGKNLQSQSYAQQWPLLVVEFKAGRTDFFYVAEMGMIIKKGDLVIVEADRGKDLGKVVEDGIQNLQQLQLYQAHHMDSLIDNHNKEVHPKRIYRLAQPAEVAMLVAKSQDEAKAMAVCQVKIRQKKLPMEIVDAEYQWDRRKLTFYFVADRRIDFRELVRDLFKLYKTRIWMCAVNPMSAILKK
ncbi:hypothetical protein HDU85_004853 [Gaertneriomyces sp. JEL0708]|nr:hypothetical protein HDU85_004853 [Gaertneriomyces sp. JEL0708]